MPRLAVAAIALQQRRQPVARLLLSGMAGEEGEQRFGLSRRQPNVPAVGATEAKST